MKVDDFFIFQTKYSRHEHGFIKLKIKNGYYNNCNICI